MQKIAPYKTKKRGRKSKPVNQYDLNGILINEFGSISEASRITGVPAGNICACCRLKALSAGKFMFQYA